MIPEPNSINLPGAESESQPRWVPPETLQQLAQDGDDETLTAVIAVFKSDTTSRLGLLQSAIASAEADRGDDRTQGQALTPSASMMRSWILGRKSRIAWLSRRGWTRLVSNEIAIPRAGSPGEPMDIVLSVVP